MKVTIVWKDPDATDGDGKYLYESDEYEKLRQLGAGEYLAVEFDTDAMTARVIPPKVRS